MLACRSLTHDGRSSGGAVHRLVCVREGGREEGGVASSKATEGPRLRETEREGGRTRGVGEVIDIWTVGSRRELWIWTGVVGLDGSCGPRREL